MRAYLDTNIILDWFKKNTSRIRNKEKLITTSKIEFLTSKKFELFVSSITKAEIFRYLKSEWGSPEDECETTWTKFIVIHNVTDITESIYVDFEELADICAKTSLGKKTLANLIHLQFAKKNKFTFVTGDKIIIERLGWYYSKIVSYPELRTKFS